MSSIPVIGIFDIGKTNKKLFLFDANYQIVYKKIVSLPETVDEDGFPCENLKDLNSFIFDSLNEVLKLDVYEVKAINFSAYGASFVNLGFDGSTITNLFNYLKPYPELLAQKFYKKYWGEEKFSTITASPMLGSLNSGLQLYRLKNENPIAFKNLKYALHLPQYLSFLLTGKCFSDITSIGCHTALWDFKKHQYHPWVYKEHVNDKLAPIAKVNKIQQIEYNGQSFMVGIGIHDSSSALVPYLKIFKEPFVLISTGTWSISLNPFNKSELTSDELKVDCLNYFQYQGRPVKASRFFLGNIHDNQCIRISKYFNQDLLKYKSLEFDLHLINNFKENKALTLSFDTIDLSIFSNYEEAYHALMIFLVNKQIGSTILVLRNSNIKRIFIDGGFSNNSIFTNLLALCLPDMKVFSANIAEATALGAALVLHKNWNKSKMQKNLINLKRYKVSKSKF